MTKLTDTQLVVLSAAAKREDGSILPLPENLKGGAVTKVVDGLTRRGLVERIPSQRPAVPDLVRITRAGLDAIGVDPQEDGPAHAREQNEAKAAPRSRRKKVAIKRVGGGRQQRAGTKQEMLIRLLRRAKGATIDEVVEATGWQPHTVRGAIAGALKKRLGLKVESEKVEGRGRVYSIAV